MINAWRFHCTSWEAPPCTVPSGSSLWTFLSSTSPGCAHIVLVGGSGVGACGCNDGGLGSTAAWFGHDNPIWVSSMSQRTECSQPQSGFLDS